MTLTASSHTTSANNAISPNSAFSVVNSASGVITVTSPITPPTVSEALAKTPPMNNHYRKRKHHRGRRSRRHEQSNTDNDFSDIDDDEEQEAKKSQSGSPSAMDDDRRAHHNELERRRRDHIKDHFMNLKNSIPLLEGEKSSRALILKRAVDYISMLQSQLKEYRREVEEMRRQKELFNMARHNAVAAAAMAAATNFGKIPQQQAASFVPANSHQLPSPTVLHSPPKGFAPIQNAPPFFGNSSCSPPNSSPPFPFATTIAPTSSPSTSNPSIIMNNSTLSPPSALLPPLHSPISSLTTSVAESLKMCDTAASPSSSSHHLNGILSSLLLQNHFSQIQQQQQQQMGSISCSAPAASTMTTFVPNATEAANCLPAGLYSSNSDQSDAQLLANSLALREQLAAASVISSSNSTSPQIG